MQHELIDEIISAKPAPARSKYAAFEEGEHVKWTLHRLPMARNGQLSRLECYCCSYIRYPRIDMARWHEVEELNGIKEHLTKDEMQDFVRSHDEMIKSHEGCGCGSELSRRKSGFHQSRAFCQKWTKAPERRKRQCTMQYNGTSKSSTIFQYFELEYADKTPDVIDMERAEDR